MIALLSAYGGSYSLNTIPNPGEGSSGTATKGADGDSTTANLNTQEPWYIGFNYTGPRDDPEYSAESNTLLWTNFGKFIDNQ